MMLQTQWERTLAEIWACGEQVLGKDAMTALLLGGDASPESPRQAQKSKECASDGAKGRKRVAFKDTVPDRIPKMLHHPSALPQVPRLPDIPVEEVGRMEKTVAQLGEPQLADLRRLSDEQDRWFETKIKQLVAVWKAEV